MVYRSIHYFSCFCSKHRLLVLVRTASSRRFLRVLTIHVLSRNMKNIRIFYLKIFIVLVVKFSVYLNMHVFVMQTARMRRLIRVFAGRTWNLVRNAVPLLHCWWRFKISNVCVFSLMTVHNFCFNSRLPEYVRFDAHSSSPLFNEDRRGMIFFLLSDNLSQ